LAIQIQHLSRTFSQFNRAVAFIVAIVLFSQNLMNTQMKMSDIEFPKRKKIRIASFPKLVKDPASFDPDVWKLYKVQMYHLDNGKVLVNGYDHLMLYESKSALITLLQQLHQFADQNSRQEPIYTTEFLEKYENLAEDFLQKHHIYRFRYHLDELGLLENSLQQIYSVDEISPIDFVGLVAVLVKIYLQDFPGTALKLEFFEEHQRFFPVIVGQNGFRVCPQFWLSRSWYEQFREKGKRVGMYKEMKQQRALI
jgi:hypothetical protein